MNVTLVEFAFYLLVSLGLGFLVGQFIKINVSWVQRMPYQLRKRKEDP